MTLRLRLTLFYTGLLKLLIVAVGAFLVVRLRVDLIGTIDDGLGPAARQIALDYGEEGLPEFRDSAGTVSRAIAPPRSCSRRTGRSWPRSATQSPATGCSREPSSRAGRSTRPGVASAWPPFP